ncbi:MAG: hypothetical protein E2O56_03400 [Gammaproteobacteria bacterium]|nr:MAG: hypothetical protein E2O56_03400 [Gammaproteobacteria bacterium]
MNLATSRDALLDEDALIDAFETCTLPKGALDHAAHVRVAWIYLQDLPLVRALERFAVSLKRYAQSVGADGLYHETITWTYMFLINERRERAPGSSWEEFAAANPDLFGDHKQLLSRYYSQETLHSDLARRTFVMPDASARIHRRRRYSTMR